jgi:hypothetical protein
MRFAKVVFLVAGIYGLAVMMPLYFMEGRIGSEMPPAITHPEYFYGFAGVTLAWQLLFLVLASDPLRYRSMMLPAVVEKVSYVVALAVLALQHRVPAAVLVFGFLDGMLAILLVSSYVVTRVRHA